MSQSLFLGGGGGRGWLTIIRFELRHLSVNPVLDVILKKLLLRFGIEQLYSAFMLMLICQCFLAVLGECRHFD